jgi:outer membrane protein assembly factor BamB
LDTSGTTRSLPRRLALACAALFGLLLLWTATAFGQAVTGDATWTQFQGSALHSGTAVSAPVPPFTEAWHADVPLGGPNQQWGLSAPVISGDTVVAVDPEQVVGFTLADGTAAFTVDRALGPPVPPAVATVGKVTAVVYTEGFGTEPPSAVPTSPSASAPPTGTASPTVTGSPSRATPSGSATPTEGATSTASRLAAFDLDTRRPLWPPISLDQVSRTGVTVDGGTAYVGDDLGTIYAVDLTDGKLLWKQSVGGSPLAPVAVAASLVIATVPGSSQARPAVVALKSGDGTLAWRYEGSGFGTAISAAAVPATADAVYVAFPDNVVRAFGLDGSVRWSHRLNSSVSPTGSPVVTDDAVYTLDLFGQLTRIDPSTGAAVWDYAINEPVTRGAPVLAGGHVLAATGKGRLAAIDPASGHLVWQSDASGNLLRGLTPTPDLIVAVRGGTQAGLVAFRNDPAGVLVDVVSPTVFNPGTFARNFALATLAFVFVLVLIGRLLSERLGPAFIVEDGEDDVEPVDPWGAEET